MGRLIITVSGCVQGVGFRPFVYRLAQKYDLKGSIANTTAGVAIDVQGEEGALSLFQRDLEKPPPGAKIEQIAIAQAEPHEADSFAINASISDADTALPLLPDTAICARCLEELENPRNRRFRYPFLHCTACGPRFSLFYSIPFDRANTAMKAFQMCGECLKEYADPENRRFYSQTNCCPHCGPTLRLLNSNEEPLKGAVRLLEQGKIVALKNTGGYQLLVDATDESAVKRLRTLKQREGKPFALLMPTLSAIRQIAEINSEEERALTSPAAPIVLLQKKGSGIAPSAAEDSPCFGAMLPHNALQHLLMKALNRPLVATSGNISGRPLCITEEEALSQLSGVADAFLVHDRAITHRLDDSVVQIMAGQPVVMRRARGLIPYAIPFKPDSPPLFAAGSQQKNSFAFKKESRIYISQHIGDLESAATCRAYVQEVEKWERLLNQGKGECIGDKHPDYYTSQYMRPTAAIQHHEAHVWAGMMDNQIEPPFLAIAWDGTGWGGDGTIWGGEAFSVDGKGIQRVASLYPFRLPGGEKAVREPRRALLGALEGRNGMFTQEEERLLLQALKQKVNSPLCSSVGRLFDAVSALLGCCAINQFEGQAAMRLETLAHQAQERIPRYRLPLINENGLLLIDYRPMLNEMMYEKASAEIAWAFHEALAHAILDLSQGHAKVLLTGGVMQNKLLVEMAIDKLRRAGITPYWHRNIPPNDGGLAVGQIVGLTVKND